MCTDWCSPAYSPGDIPFSNLEVNTVALSLYFSQLICLFNSKLEGAEPIFSVYIWFSLSGVLSFTQHFECFTRPCKPYNVRNPYTPQAAVTRIIHISLNLNAQVATLFRPLCYQYKFHDTWSTVLFRQQGTVDMFMLYSLLLQYHTQTSDHLCLVP